MEIHGPLPPLFDGLSAQDKRSALDHFRLVQVDAGTQLIVEGERDTTLAVVLSGELEVTDHGAVVGRVRAGGMVGEMAFFAGGVRRASVSTVSPARLLLLEQERYLWLRSHGHPIAWAVEDQALRELTARQRRVVERLAEVGSGTRLERLTRTPSLLRRIASALGSGGTFRPRLGRARVLGMSPLFTGAPPEALVELSRHFQRFGARRGQPICIEGQEGNELYVIASGEVDLVVSTRHDRVERIVTLGPGAAFGIGALVRVGEPRHATAVARSKVQAVSLHKLKWAELGGRGDLVGSVLRVALVRALIEQLDFANERLAQLDPAAALAAETAFDAHGPFLVGGELTPWEEI